jgi:hypothetical protein
VKRVAALIIATAAVSILRAAEPPQPLTPVIQSIFPRGGRAGSEFSVTIRGKYLSGASRLRFSGTGVAAEITEVSDSRIVAEVRIEEGADTGRRDLRVFTPQGSFVQVFDISNLPEQIEPEPNDDRASAPTVQLPVIINGKITPGDYDHFRFHATAGQVLVFDFKSSRIGTRFDGTLSLLDESGREVAANDDFYFDKDPHLVYRFPQSGEYVLRVSGFREAGSNASEYRLMMGELPALSWVFPAGGRRGQSVDLTIGGANLESVDRIVLDGVKASATILEKTGERLKARMTLPQDLQPGFYLLRVCSAQSEIPNPLIFVVSDYREVVISGDPPGQPLDLTVPLVLNGVIATPRHGHNFWIEVRSGEKISLEADGMSLGNFLDPAATIYDTGGNVVAYIDESAPNGFDKEPPNLDFHLDHTFEKAGRYRIEFRDAALRGREEFVYRLLVRRSEPEFEVIALTNQISVLAGNTASVPVRVRRLGGWNAPVRVWVEGLPSRVGSQSMTAEPVNTRFRGTFGEDFFFDGTNVDVPLQAQPSASPGILPLRVKARGTMDGKTLERTAVVFYPWQQTGYLRGKSDDQDLVMTVADAARFELEVPPAVEITRGKPVEVPLRVRWFGSGADAGSLRIEAQRMSAGLKVDRFTVEPGGEKVSVWISAGGELQQTSGYLSLVGVLGAGQTAYRRVSPDIQWSIAPRRAGQAMAEK